MTYIYLVTGWSGELEGAYPSLGDARKAIRRTVDKCVREDGKNMGRGWKKDYRKEKLAAFNVTRVRWEPYLVEGGL